MDWFPNFTCMACGCEIQSSNNKYLCLKCMNNLPIVSESQTTHFSPFTYEDPIRKMILELKYNDNGYIAKALAPYLAAVYLKQLQPLYDKPPIIIPVPLHKSRHRERGYNQSEILAKELSKYLNLEIHTNLLIRKRKTIIQKHMDTKARFENIHGAFDIKANESNNIQNQNILLLDDVYTTGATTNECKNILLRHGARKVLILTIASVF